MNIETRTTGFFEENCYFISNPDTREIVVIDPGADAPQLIARLRELDATVPAILMTHGHADHLSALAELANAFSAPVYIHPEDAAWCFTDLAALPGFYDTPVQPETPILTALPLTEPLLLAGGHWMAIETPGHSPGGVCWTLQEEQALFAGDTLFCGSAGRTDLPGGDARTLTQSLRKLAAFPDDWTVYPGHGDPTTLSHEKKHNYFMQF
jgi:hydroxyacylglutathione hydrolase